jgi:hypothetical protein
MYSSGLQLPKVSFSEIDYNSIPDGSFFIGFNIDNAGKLSKIDKNGVITVIEGAGGSSGLITVTKLELDNLISSDLLSVGSFYYITGVDSSLYGGTDIILQAISENEISEDGIGFFYNPKYSDYEIYNPYVVVDIPNITGEFDFNEPFTSDNSTTGTIIGNCVSGNKAFLLTSNLMGLTSSVTITGDTSSETADILIYAVPPYGTNSKVIWGGLVWENTSNDLGQIVDIYNLSTSDWQIIPFNTTDYNYVADSIKYDYINDLIIYRREENSDSSVSTQYLYNTIFESQYTGYPANPIKAFQWGNPYDIGTSKGNISNKVENSYFECINFNTRVIAFNQIDRLSVIYNVQTVGITLNNIPSFDSNSLSYGSLISDLIIIDDGQFIANQLYNSELETIILQKNNIRNMNIEASSLSNLLCFNTDIIDNLLFNSSMTNINSIGATISSNSLNFSLIGNNTLKQNANINNNDLSQNSSISGNTLLVNGQIVFNNLLQNSTINDNIISNTSVYYNKLVNSSINLNTANGGSSFNGNLLSLGSYISINTLDGCQINSNILDSYSAITANQFDNVSTNENSLLISSTIDSNTITGSNIIQNILSNYCYITNSTKTGVDTSSISNNRLENSSYIEFLALDYSTIDNNILTRDSYISEMLGGPQLIQVISNTIDLGSRITNNVWNGGIISNNTISNNSNIQSNTLNSGLINRCTLLNYSVIQTNTIGSSGSIIFCSLELSSISSFIIPASCLVQYFILKNSSMSSWDLTTESGNSANPCNFINMSIINLSYFPTLSVYIGMPQFADNAAALAGGVPIGGLYRVTATGTVQIVI